MSIENTQKETLKQKIVITNCYTVFDKEWEQIEKEIKGFLSTKGGGFNVEILSDNE